MFERSNGFTDLSEKASITSRKQVSMPNFQDSSPPKGRSALAIFCRAPRLGTVKTRIAKSHGDEFALGLYRAMLADTFALGRALSPEVETFACFTPNDGFDGEDSLAGLWDGPRLAQCDGDLGAKILDCFAQLRAQGFEKIIVIGSDSPDLPLKRLRRAFEILEEAPMVIFGRAPDGGFSLMGASLDVPTWLFEGVKWSSSQTLAMIRRNNSTRMEAGLNWADLPAWRDVDDEADWLELRRRLFELGTHAPQTRDFAADSP